METKPEAGAVTAVRSQLIENNYASPDPQSRLYLVKLSDGRKIEVLYSHRLVTGVDHSGPNDPNDRSCASRTAIIVDTDSKREFGEIALPDIISQLVNAFVTNRSTKLRRQKAPLTERVPFSSTIEVLLGR